MLTPEEQPIRLTEYSRGAGCGCKIAPATLQEILHSKLPIVGNPNLLVGNGTNDDAAVYDIGGGQALISTTDFFMPIVDDAYQFGQVAAANAISDVYAMGGNPLMALAILGWPIDKLPASLAAQVLEGARSVCADAGIPLAGGHSIDSLEPIFGLAVSGLVNKSHLKRNSTAKANNVILLTKALGTGVLATALKRGLLQPKHGQALMEQLTSLNKVGSELGKLPAVTAMTDVTGFGLCGHLIEMAEASSLSAVLHYSQIPVIEGVAGYLAQRTIPDATYRNWNAYGSKIDFKDGVNVMEAFSLLPDPQTNGGLLIAVEPEGLEEVQQLLVANGLYADAIGEFVPQAEKLIYVA
jgi:selenide, water dikinase